MTCCPSFHLIQEGARVGVICGFSPFLSTLHRGEGPGGGLTAGAG